MHEIWDLLVSTTVSIPTHEILALMLLQAFCFLFRTLRIGLLVSFTFVYVLGWRFIQQQFGVPGMPYLYGYAVFGLLVVALAIYSWWAARETS